MLAIWSLVPLPFLKPSWTSGSSQFMYCWSLAWRILSITLLSFRSVQFSCSVVSDSLWPHESQHARPPCPSPSPGVHSDSHPSSQWCHPAILSSVVPFSSCPESLPASESFPVSQLFAWGGQSTIISCILFVKTVLSSKTWLLKINICKVEDEIYVVQYFVPNYNLFGVCWRKLICTVNKTVWYWHKTINVDQWNRVERPEINPRT